MTTRKGDFFQEVQTQDTGRTVNVSFTDQLEVMPPRQVDPPAQEMLLLQVGKEGAYATAYLGRTQVDALILALQQARSIWFGEW